MRRSRSAERLPIDPEIERTFHQLQRQRWQELNQVVMDQPPDQQVAAPPIPIRD